MVQAAWPGPRDADLVVVVLDAKRGLDGDSRLRPRRAEAAAPAARRCSPSTRSTWSGRPRLLPLIQAANEASRSTATFLVSALTGDGCEDLLDRLRERLPEGPWLSRRTSSPTSRNRALAAEITREQLFIQLHQELPYSITVETEGWAESPDGGEIRIDQTIYVQRDSQKAIVLGRAASRSRRSARRPARSSSAMLEARVHLFLFVKVRENWQDDPERYREMGLEQG